jgi:hypothetical protein
MRDYRWWFVGNIGLESLEMSDPLNPTHLILDFLASSICFGLQVGK